MQTLSDFYTQRNVRFIKKWHQLQKEGMKTREVATLIAEKNNVSFGCVMAVYYDRKYPYSAAAWEIIHKEQAEKQAAEKNEVVNP